MTVLHPLTDLVISTDRGPRLPASVHHLPDLLEMSAEDVLDRFKASQEADFGAVVTALERSDDPLRRLFQGVRDVGGDDTDFARSIVFQPGGLSNLFQDLHGHVMAHPVWRHPFFLRVFEGPLSRAEVRRFLLHYFNQVKNTRQCVALAIGRFHSLVDFPYGLSSQPVSELTQVVLAQLVADEYGVGASSLEDYPSLDGVFRSTTHITLYRRLLDALGIPAGEQDVTLLPGVADNVLTQRLVAGSPEFTPLEALSSVGLGMEWGVPEFFSLLLGGMIRHAVREALPLRAHDLEIFIAHVKYDVLHAVSVMAATALHMQGEDGVARVKNAVNMLMSARYDMMSSLYQEVFGEPVSRISDIGLDPRWHITDRRIEAALIAARKTVGVGTVKGQEVWAQEAATPFVFTS